ncbi:MAG: hypothetical protein DWQ19_11645 [Crenarchaeota archaeon]|nr:MAG: hypothetical protein DWQ19_11645 [Thermoproteota archaeon]
MPRMGFDFGLEAAALCAKQKFRWLFIIPSISADGINSLPPLKGARPSVSFKEIQAEHLNETISYPGKPEWKPVDLSLYDLKKNIHPVFGWLQRLYNPGPGEWSPPLDNEFIISEAYLELYDGCGGLLERWIFENVWPSSVDFGELEMGDSEIVTCDLSIKYARAYINQTTDI